MILKFIRNLFKIRKRYLIAFILLVIISLFIFQRTRAQKPLELATVQKQTLRQVVSSSGSITGTNTANLKFLSSGKLSFVNVKVGDQVIKDQEIAGLDTQQLSINLQQSQNTLKSSQATVEKVLDDIHLYQYGNGGFGNVGTPSETETQRQSRVAAETARDNAVDSVKLAQRAFQDATISSPIDGIITSQNPLPGQVVSPADTIAQVVDLTEIIFAADVDEADISKVGVGQRAEITLDAYGDRIFKGFVEEVVPQTKTASNGGTVVTVKIKLNAQDIKQIAGLNGQAIIIQNERSNILTIPLDAFGSESQVVVKTPLGLQIRKIKTDFTSDTDIEVTEGLQEGDQVLLNPNDYLKTHKK